MPQRDNPLSLSVLGQLDFTGRDEKFQELVERIDRDDQSRAEWIEQCRQITKQLRGEEERKRKPWKHASTLSIPLTKKLLRRWIPTLYNLIAFADPVSHFKASTFQAAEKAPTVETWFTWLLKDYMDDTLSEIQFLVHDVGAFGMGYLGVSWDYRTQLNSRVVLVDNLFPQGVPDDPGVILQTLQTQYDIPQPTQELVTAAQKIAAGDKYVRLSYRGVVADKPRIVRHDPKFVIVPPNSGRAEEAEYVALMHEFNASQLRGMALDGLLDEKAVAAVIEKAGSDDGQVKKARRWDTQYADYVQREMQEDTGVNVIKDDAPIRVYQVYCHLDYNGDGIDERCVLWYSPLGDEGPTILALHPFVFSFKHWPIFRFDYEKVDRRPYLSQGMGKQLKDIQSQYTKQYRATSDAIDVQLAPVFQFRAGSPLAPRTFKWGPGRFYPVAEVGDIAPIEKSPLNLHQYLQDRGELKMFAEEMVGSIDAALAATGKQLERRTAFEVQAISGGIEAVQGMDAAIFQQTMSKVFQCVWELWLDLGPDVVYYNVTGEPMPKLFRKSEHSYKYQLTPAGTPGNTNRKARIQDLLLLAQVATQLYMEGTNRGQLVYLIAKEIDPRVANQIILRPEDQQQQQLLMQAAAQVAQGELPESMKALMASGAEGGQ